MILGRCHILASFRWNFCQLVMLSDCWKSHRNQQTFLQRQGCLLGAKLVICPQMIFIEKTQSFYFQWKKGQSKNFKQTVVCTHNLQIEIDFFLPILMLRYREHCLNVSKCEMYLVVVGGWYAATHQYSFSSWWC